MYNSTHAQCFDAEDNAWWRAVTRRKIRSGRGSLRALSSIAALQAPLCHVDHDSRQRCCITRLLLPHTLTRSHQLAWNAFILL
jgi:hypothetical protein